MDTQELIPGLAGEITTTVTAQDLACVLGSGDVTVLGTPRMIALAEAATLRAIASALTEGQTSVGTRVDIRHLAASPEGSQIKALAELYEVKGKVLTFRITVNDGYGLVAEGMVERIVVDRAKFTERAQQPRTK
ncbi:MAG: hypothetical protein RLZZ136_28 [Pseudomonadota bacterium]|jgi:predicted thioesterase